MKKKTLLLAIAFGTSVRDVLRNDTFKMLKARKDLRIVLFAQDVGVTFREEFGGDNVEFEALVPVRPSITERILLHFHRALLRDRCRTIDLGNTSGDTSTIDRFTPLARLCLKYFGSARMNKIIHFFYQVLAPGKQYNDEFAKYKPDLVVVTRVLNYSADYAIMRRAAIEKIPVIALVSSWDNLTSKAFFPFSLETVVVWNYVLEKELIELFQFPEKRIVVAGIPRYDLFFRKKGFCSRTDFFKKKGLDPNKRLITYGTGSKTTARSPLDPITPEPNIANFIADQIDSGAIPNAQLIVRLHPQVDVSHYHMLQDRKNVILDIPGAKSNFQDRLFSQKDDIEFGEMMLYSDMVINFASTITIDAAVFDTPILCVNFDFNGKRPYGISPRRFYDFDHYAKLRKMNGFKLSNSREELVKDIVETLENPQQYSTGRNSIVDQQCVFTDGRSGERIAQHILATLDGI